VTEKKRLVLASNSPRRRELLSLFGWEYDIRPADVDETPRQGEKPVEYVRHLAKEKARACAREAHPGETIIAADTTVVLNGKILGKPQDAEEAAAMLRRLCGRNHQVCTGIAVLDMKTDAFIQDLCVTEVPMRDYSEEELLAYAASGDPLDKAGGYAIQDPIFRPVDSLHGCYASVMGLPLCHLGRSLKKVGYAPTGDFPAACQSSLHYYCPIHARVLKGEEIG
jgi:septum formation protein